MDGLTGLTGAIANQQIQNVYVFGDQWVNRRTHAGGKICWHRNRKRTTTGVAVHPNGNFVYDFSLTGSTGFDGPLDGFSLNTTTGALTSLAPFANTSTLPPNSGISIRERCVPVLSCVERDRSL